MMELAAGKQHRISRFVLRSIIIQKDLSVMEEKIIHRRDFNVGFINSYVGLYTFICGPVHFQTNTLVLL